MGRTVRDSKRSPAITSGDQSAGGRTSSNAAPRMGAVGAQVSEQVADPQASSPPVQQQPPGLPSAPAQQQSAAPDATTAVAGGGTGSDAA